MDSLKENRGLRGCLLLIAALLVMTVSGAFPDFAAALQVVEFPAEVSAPCIAPIAVSQAACSRSPPARSSAQFRMKLLAVMAADLAGAFAVDRLLLRLCGHAKLRQL